MIGLPDENGKPRHASIRDTLMAIGHSRADRRRAPPLSIAEAGSNRESATIRAYHPNRTEYAFETALSGVVALDDSLIIFE
jgi:hypothetical protein